jgi:hypothetical protein
VTGAIRRSPRERPRDQHTGVDDMRHFGQPSTSLGPQQAMGVRDDSNPQRCAVFLKDRTGREPHPERLDGRLMRTQHPIVAIVQLGRERINRPSRRLAKVRYAPIAIKFRHAAK